MASTDLHRGDTPSRAIGAIVLAAGESRRMGRPKQLLQFKGETLLRRASRAAIEAGCEPVIVVLGNRSDEFATELANLPVNVTVNVTVNATWASGIGSSIRVGLQRILEISPASDALLIMLCDQPLIDATILRQLIATYRQSSKAICASSFARTIGPPVVVGREFFPKLANLADDRGAKEIWLKHPESFGIFACEAAAADIDTPADYERLR
jgi:molybdenum cofactor cytidylyltransferase